MNKKIFLSTLSMVPTAALCLATINASSQKKEIKTLNSGVNSEINWGDVKQSLEKFLRNIRREHAEELKLNLMFEKVAEKIEEIVNESIKNSYSLEILLDKLSKEYPEFAQKKSILELGVTNTKENFAFSDVGNGERKYVTIQNSISKLKKLVNDLRISKTTFITVSAAAAIAAAGFFAASFWTIGLTAKLGAKCAFLSATSGGVAAGINFALLAYDKELSKWEKVGKGMVSSYYLGHIFYKTLKPLLISVNIAAGAATWFFPIASTIIPVASAILSWIELYK